MHVVGGCYVELCDEPYWSQLYGSGGRAAAAIAGRITGLKFSTYISDKHLNALKLLEGVYDFESSAFKSPDTIHFYYNHPLATPVITPKVSEIGTLDSIYIEDDVILRFGMLEGDAEVHGSYVTYDPQSPFSPSPFIENGSTAEHLSIVCNAVEAKLLAGANDVEEAANRLLDVAEVVVVKMGSRGALVQTRTSVSQISAYQTSRVWPIGSGDVFAAVYALEWGEYKKSPKEAAEIASRATAYYCESQSLPVPDPSVLPDYDPIRPLPDSDDPPQVYLAGPFFTAAERWIVAELRHCLRQQGVKVFSPYHDVGHGSADDVVHKDIAAIKTSSVMLAILDGLDAGTLFEVGYARALDIPVVGFVQSEGEESMKMLEGTDCQLVDDIVTAIYHTVWAASHE